MSDREGDETPPKQIPVGSISSPDSSVLLKSADWGDTWINIGAPTLFGVVVGSFWQWQIAPQLSSLWPNPIQAALLSFVLLSPLFHQQLTSHEFSRWKEYALGTLLPSLYIIGIWFIPGLTGMFCGGYLATIVWIWMCTSWWRFDLPPFRSALWHVLGVNIGALGASILTYNLML